MTFHRSRRSPFVPVAGIVLALSIASSSVAPLLAAAQDPQMPRTGVQVKDPVAQWKQELADAKLRRTKAREMEVGGFLLAIGSDILATVIATNCRRGCGLAPVVGVAGIGTGIALGHIGKTRATDANVEIGALLVRAPKEGASVALPLGKGSPIVLTVGQTTGIAYRVRW